MRTERDIMIIAIGISLQVDHRLVAPTVMNGP